MGCKKDESPNPTDYQIDEYSEGILGHWKTNQIQEDSIITSYFIDPVFGSQTSEVILDWDTTINYPRYLYDNHYFDYYYTYRYDNTYWYDLFRLVEGSTDFDYGWGNLLDGYDPTTLTYSISGDSLSRTTTGGGEYNFRITNMSETRMVMLVEYLDTISISTNEYQISSRIVNLTYERVEELPLSDDINY